MEILSGADKPKDIVSKEYVDGQINNHVHDADEIPCSTKILKLGDTEYKISENLQKALENLLDYIYMNASGVLDLQTNLKSVSDTVKKIPAYKGGTGISIAGDTIGHSNNTLPGMVGTGEILTPDFGDTVYTTWFSYDAQGHVTQSGTGGFKIPTAETELDTKSANPIANSKATSEINRLDSRINSKADMTYAVSLAEKIDAKADASELAKVATTGSYNDLSDKPTLGNVAAKTIKTATTRTDAGWTDNATSQKYVPDMSFIAYWDGASSTGKQSNLTYCNQGAFGAAATKGVDVTATYNSMNLITSGAMYTALNNKLNTSSNDLTKTWWCGTDSANSAGWYHFMTVTMVQYADFNMTLSIKNEYTSLADGILSIHIRCDSTATTAAPNIFSWLVRRGWNVDSVGAVVDGLNVKFYVYQPTSQYGGMCFRALSLSTRRGGFGETKGAGYCANTKFTAVSSTAPTTGLTLSNKSTDSSIVGTAINASTWDGHTTAQTVLFTAESDVKSATIDGLFTKYTLIWAQFVGSKTTHTHIIPLAYLKSKGSLMFKDSGVAFNIIKDSDTSIRWFEYQGQGAESYTSVTIVKII